MISATVTTTVLLGGLVHLQDKVVFSDVDQAVIDFLDGSCKLAMAKLMHDQEMAKLMHDQEKTEGGYSLHYNTVFVDSNVGLAINKKPSVTVRGLTKSQINSFLSFGLLELSKLNNLRYGADDVHGA